MPIKSPVIVPKATKGWVSHDSVLGSNSYDLNNLYSPDNALAQSCVLDLASPKFNPHPTTIFDKSGKNNHGTITGTTWVRNAQGVMVISEDGTDDTVTVAGTAASLQISGDLTIKIWANISNFKTQTTLVTKLTAWSQGYWFDVQADSMQLQWSDSVLGANAEGINAGDHSLNTWYMFSVVRIGTNVLFYRNGSQYGATQSAVGGGTILTGNTNMQIGGNQASHGGDFFVGRLGLPIIENRALSALEIANIYNQERHLFGV